MIGTLFLATIISLGASDSDTIDGVVVYGMSASRVLKMGDPIAAAASITRRVDELNGWVLNQDQQKIVARVPVDSVSHLLSTVDSLGLILDRTLSRSDYTQEYWQYAAQVRAKEKLLTEYLRVLDSSRAEAIYPVSREVVDLQRSIEEAKGKMRGIEARAKYAEVQIHFQFHDRRPPPDWGRSNFPWLNRVDMRVLIEEFRQ